MAQVSLKCSQCNGDMAFDSNRKVFICKYCGNVESVDVQIQRIKIQAYKDVEMARQQTEQKKKRKFWTNYEETKAHFLERMMSSDGGESIIEQNAVTFSYAPTG